MSYLSNQRVFTGRINKTLYLAAFDRATLAPKALQKSHIVDYWNDSFTNELQHLGNVVSPLRERNFRIPMNFLGVFGHMAALNYSIIARVILTTPERKPRLFVRVYISHAAVIANSRIRGGVRVPKARIVNSARIRSNARTNALRAVSQIRLIVNRISRVEWNADTVGWCCSCVI